MNNVCVTFLDMGLANVYPSKERANQDITFLLRVYKAGQNESPCKIPMLILITLDVLIPSLTGMLMITFHLLIMFVIISINFTGKR